LGIRAALGAQATRAPTPVSVLGTVPRSTGEAEEAVYFACSEAIQNVAKHAGAATRVTIRLHHDCRWLTVGIGDDGPGFDPPTAQQGAGLGNIRSRIEDLGGTFSVDSTVGRGTALAIALPWPPASNGRR